MGKEGAMWEEKGRTIPTLSPSSLSHGRGGIMTPILTRKADFREGG